VLVSRSQSTAKLNKRKKLSRQADLRAAVQKKKNTGARCAKIAHIDAPNHKKYRVQLGVQSRLPEKNGHGEIRAGQERQAKITPSTIDRS
jgi:hypothetical protein